MVKEGILSEGDADGSCGMWLAWADFGEEVTNVRAGVAEVKLPLPSITKKQCDAAMNPRCIRSIDPDPLER
jgi:hypothetical protein